MFGPFQGPVDKLEPLPLEEGPDKTTSLPQAVRKFVKPGMLVHLSTTHNRPGAAIMELVREFRGKDPRLTLSCVGFVSNGVLPVHTGIAKKLISTFTGDSYPTPGPNPVITRAWASGELEIENWSILSFTQRLMAGAMGFPWMPTNSISGSSMAEDNEGLYREEVLEDGNRTGMVAALRPDVAFIHAPCADRAGNVILTPPFGEDCYGAYAAKDGVIVSVDKIVSTEFVRRNSHLAKIPGYMVLAVCPVPLGAHPGGVSSQGLPDFESYADDYEFMLDIRDASKSRETMDEWIKHWMDDAPDWESYLAKLGKDRIWTLKGKARPDSWKTELLEMADKIPDGPEYTPIEMMVVGAGRKLADRMRTKGWKTILAGVGTSNLAAWLAYYSLLEDGTECDLMAEIGFYGYAPRPADPFIFNYRNMPAAKMLTGIPNIMGVFMGGSANCSIGAIGAGQIDSKANINTTMIPGVAWLTGSGGGNDIASSACEVLVTAFSGRKRFVKELPYVTSPGRAVRTVVSESGVFEKERGESELVLTEYFPVEGQGEDETVQGIRENCGWDLKVSSSIRVAEPPALSELRMVRILDPKRQFLGKR